MTRSRLFAAVLGALACGLGVVATANGGAGASIVYVDGGGICAGNSPCLATIQQAVRLAGPAPALINVFPGAYNESVNLNELGADIGSSGGPGDVVMQTVDASAAPVPGTATITASGGTAAIRATASYAGAVTIRGFNVTADGDGIRLNVTGNATIEDVTASNSGGYGAAVASLGQVSILGSTATGNDDGGFQLSANGVVLIADSTANENVNADTGDGFNIASQTDILALGITANNNGDDGFDVDAASGEITIDGCEVRGNGDEGIDIDGLTGTVSISSCEVAMNDDNGAAIGNSEVAGSVTGATVTDSDFTQNGDDGLDFALAGPATVTCVNFVNNGEAGISLDSGNVAIAAEGNWWDSPSGPEHPGNPGGTGDAVRDSANGGEGTIDYMPFLNGTCVPDFFLFWGDLTCNGAVEPKDALQAALHIEDLPLLPSDNCPVLGDTYEIDGYDPRPFADMDCDFDIDGEDMALILFYAAGLTLPDPATACPAPGEEVTLRAA